MVAPSPENGRYSQPYHSNIGRPVSVSWGCHENGEQACSSHLCIYKGGHGQSGTMPVSRLAGQLTQSSYQMPVKEQYTGATNELQNATAGLNLVSSNPPRDSDHRRNGRHQNWDQSQHLARHQGASFHNPRSRLLPSVPFQWYPNAADATRNPPHAAHQDAPNVWGPPLRREFPQPADADSGGFHYHRSQPQLDNGPAEGMNGIHSPCRSERMLDPVPVQLRPQPHAHPMGSKGYDSGRVGSIFREDVDCIKPWSITRRNQLSTIKRKRVLPSFHPNKGRFAGKLIVQPPGGNCTVQLG